MYCNVCNITLVGGEEAMVEHNDAHHAPGPGQVPDSSVPSSPPGSRGPIWKLGMSPAAQAEVDAKNKAADEAVFQESERISRK